MNGRNSLDSCDDCLIIATDAKLEVSVSANRTRSPLRFANAPVPVIGSQPLGASDDSLEGGENKASVELHRLAD